MTNKVFFLEVAAPSMCAQVLHLSVFFFSMIGSAEAKEFNKNPEMQLLMFTLSQKSGVQNEIRKNVRIWKGWSGTTGSSSQPQFVFSILVVNVRKCQF